MILLAALEFPFCCLLLLPGMGNNLVLSIVVTSSWPANTQHVVFVLLK